MDIKFRKTFNITYIDYIIESDLYAKFILKRFNFIDIEFKNINDLDILSDNRRSILSNTNFKNNSNTIYCNKISKSMYKNIYTLRMILLIIQNIKEFIIGNSFSENDEHIIKRHEIVIEFEINDRDKFINIIRHIHSSYFFYSEYEAINIYLNINNTRIYIEYYVINLELNPDIILALCPNIKNENNIVICDSDLRINYSSISNILQQIPINNSNINILNIEGIERIKSISINSFNSLSKLKYIK